MKKVPFLGVSKPWPLWFWVYRTLAASYREAHTALQDLIIRLTGLEVRDFSAAQHTETRNSSCWWLAPYTTHSLVTATSLPFADGGTRSDVLYKVAVPVKSQEQCMNAYRGFSVTLNMMCAGATDKDSCQVNPWDKNVVTVMVRAHMRHLSCDKYRMIVKCIELYDFIVQ